MDSAPKRHRSDCGLHAAPELDLRTCPNEALLEVSSEIYVLLDREGKVLYANPATAVRLGCEVPDLVGEEIFLHLPTDRSPELRRIFRQVVDEGAPITWTDTQDEITVQCSAKPVLGPDGRIEKVAVFARDMTETIAAQRRLTERERLLQATMESTADGILVVDDSGKVVMVNSRFAELWRVPAELLQARDDEKLLEFVLDQLQDPEAFLSKVRELYHTDARDFDTLLFKDGRVFERFSCPLLNGKEINGRVWSFRDVTKREKAAAELQDTLARYRSLFEDAPIAIYEVDLSELKKFIVQLKLTDASVLRAFFQARPEAIEQCISLIKIGDVNPSALRVYEAASREEFIAKFRNTFSPEMLDAFIDALAAIARGNTLWKAEVSKFTCAGNRREVILKVSVCPGYERTLAKALLSVVDITDRKRTEDALRSSEAKLRTVIHATQDAMISIDQAGLINLFNPAAERMFGHGSAEMIGKSLAILMPDEYRVRHAEYIRSYLETGKPDAAIGRTVELPALRADGEIFPIEISLSAGEAEGRRFVIAVLRDITERRLAQEALEESEERFRDLVEHADIAIMADNEQGELLFFNDKCARLFGYAPAEFADRRIDAIVHPGDLDWVLEYHRRRYRGEATPTRYGFRGVKKDGTILHLDISVSVLREEGKVVGTRSYLLDITELKKVEVALRESEELFQSFAETVTDVIYRFDIRKQQLDFISPSVEVHTGHPVEAIKANPWRMMNHFTHPADRRRVMRQFWAHLQRGPGHGNCYFEYRVIRKDGRVIWVSDRRDVEFDEHNKPVCVNGVSRDITIQKLREQERLQLEAQMQQAQRMESLGVLAGGIAHEFNNMLGGILGTAELILNELPGDSQLRLDIEQIMAAAGRAAHLTDQMLAYSGKGAFVVRPLGLSRVVREISELLQAAMPKGTRLEFDLAAELPPTVADLSQMRQVLMNLVTNAGEAMPERGGVVTVSTGLIDADEAYLQETIAGAEIPAGKYVYVEVCDDGCGMEHATMARMFEPFFTTKFAGRGLGLAAVDGIVRGHSGTIKINSALGKGTCIRVILPVVDTTQMTNAPQDDCDTGRCRGLILVADGEETTSYLARRILQRAGYRTVAATDQDELMAILRDQEQRIELALVDSYLSTGGIDELKQRISELPRRPAFIITGSDPEELSLANACGACFVHKPYRPQALLEAVERTLAQFREQEPNYSI
ncbi:MAG: PAS domain S-box protein [bacterium]